MNIKCALTHKNVWCIFKATVPVPIALQETSSAKIKQDGWGGLS